MGGRSCHPSPARSKSGLFGLRRMGHEQLGSRRQEGIGQGLLYSLPPFPAPRDWGAFPCMLIPSWCCLYRPMVVPQGSCKRNRTPPYVGVGQRGPGLRHGGLDFIIISGGKWWGMIPAPLPCLFPFRLVSLTGVPHPPGVPRDSFRGAAGCHAAPVRIGVQTQFARQPQRLQIGIKTILPLQQKNCAPIFL